MNVLNFQHTRIPKLSYFVLEYLDYDILKKSCEILRTPVKQKIRHTLSPVSYRIHKLPLILIFLMHKIYIMEHLDPT